MFKHNSGFIEDSFDPRDVWADELFAGETDIPEYYKVEGLRYEKQGVWPLCTSFACTTLAEWKYERLNEKRYDFSQQHLFFTSGGGEHGSSVRQNLNVLEDIGGVDYKKYPMPKDIMKKPSNWVEIGRKTAKSIPTGKARKTPGYLRVLPFKKSIKQAILNHGPLAIGVNASKSQGYYTGNAVRKTDSDNHLILLVGWDDVDNKWIIFDSLSWVEKNQGYGTLNQDYTFRFAYAMEELPEDWKEKRDEARAVPGALDHYGKQRVWSKEKDAEQALLKAFKKFKDKSVFDAAGRFWTTYINAIAYGGYTVRDVVNDCYNWRRTGEHIFDFSYETRYQWHQRIKGIL